MNCVYTYNGRDYSYAEFAAALHEGLLEDLSAKGEVVLDVEIPKIETNAVQEPSTTGVDVRQQARDGEAVGEGNAQKEEVAEKEEEKEVVSPTEQVEQPAEFEEVKQAKEKFYKHTEDKGYVEVKRAKPVYIFGTEKAFYVKEGKEFVVSDAITGAEIGRGSTLNNAVASAEENAGSVQNLESARERFTDAYGKSPYAKLQEEFSFTQSIINNAMDMADVVENEADAFVAKTENEQIADRIRSKKINGALSAIDFGLTTTIYNGALTFMANQVEKGTKLGNAIANTIKWIDEKMQGKKWDKGKFGKYMNDQYKVKMSNGDVVEVVRDDSKETAAVINGFYSDIEQRILDQKGDKKASEWLTIIGKGDEAKYTGVANWLASKGNEVVSKKELQDWMRDNRIEIVEVVKGGEGMVFDYDNAPKEVRRILDKHGDDTWDAKEELEDIGYEVDVDMDGTILSISKPGTEPTKFHQYQLEGEKEGYREVLVTLPQERKAKPETYSVKEENGKYYAVNDRTGEKLLGNKYTKEESEAQAKQMTARWELNGGRIEDAKFKSSHFDEPNILVHLRMNVRTDADGNKVLFLEEIQSDWGQQGKKQGFDLQKKYDAAKKFYNQIWKPFVRKEITKEEADKKHGELAKETGFTKTEIYDEASRWGDFTSSPGSSNVPLAPFVTDTNAWVKLGLKVAMQHAVREGATKIAWTTGEQQNERYDLSKQVDEIKVLPQYGGSKMTYAVQGFKDGVMFASQNANTISELEGIVGKEIANKVAEKGEYEGELSFKGNDLKVGGKGMKGFYGSPTEGTKGIVGSVAESLTGQKVGEVDVKLSDNINAPFDITIRDENGVVSTHNFDSKSKASAWLSKEVSQGKKYEVISEKSQNEITSTQNSIDITPELKAKITFGVPMFGGLGKINTNAYLDTMEDKGIIKRDCE